MALFKILSNMTDTSKSLPDVYHQGYCYFDVNTGKFWIDTTDNAEGRMAINANHSDNADVATVAQAARYDDAVHPIQTYYAHQLSLSDKTLSLIAGDGVTSLGEITLPDADNMLPLTGGEISGPIYPNADATIDLGKIDALDPTENRRWRNIYADTYNGSMAHSITIGDKSYNGSEDITLFASDLGVSSALSFAGIIYETLPNRDDVGYPSTQNPVHLYIEENDHQGSTIGDGTVGSINPGTVVICHDTQDEFLWSEDSAGNQGWYSLGLASSFALHNHTHGYIQNNGNLLSTINGVSSANKAVVTDGNSSITITDLTVTDPEVQNNVTATSFISSISQDSKGKITAIKSNVLDYVKKSGDTMSGNLKISHTGNVWVDATNTNSSCRILLESDDNGTHGIWSNGYGDGTNYTTSSKWLLHRGSDGAVYLSGNADSATALKDRKTGTLTYSNYGAAGLAASAITWLTCWNGYELRAISKAEVANAVDSAHKWVQVAGDTMTGLLNITTNSNTVSIGSQNVHYCHITNSAAIPFYFNRNVYADGGFTIHNGNGQLNRIGKSVGWYQGRTNALVRVTSAPSSSGWNPITSCKTTNGDWSTGTLGDTYYFVYTADTNFNAGTNTTSHDVRITSSSQLYGAVWNDYAEYRKDNTKEKDIQIPGKCVYEVGDGTLALTTRRLERGCEIISDTFGFAIGQDEENGYNTPIASNGRVLAYPYESIEEFASHIGYPVCSGPNGTVSIMTEEEEEKYPSRIIGTISEIPDYKEWGTGKVKIDGRVWIRIR